MRPKRSRRLQVGHWLLVAKRGRPELSGVIAVERVAPRDTVLPQVANGLLLVDGVALTSHDERTVLFQPLADAALTLAWLLRELLGAASMHTINAMWVLVASGCRLDDT